MNRQTHFQAVLLTAVFFLVLFVPQTHSATFNFTGTIEAIGMDTGQSRYSGLMIGDAFTGTISAGSSTSDASSIYVEPTFTDYYFSGGSYGGMVTTGTITTSGHISMIGVADDDGMGSDTGGINALYGPGSTTEETIADVWSLVVRDSAGKSLFGIGLYFLDTALYSGLDFQEFPPPLHTADFTMFFIYDYDTEGNEIYLAGGRLASLNAVPAPGAFLLFGSGLLCIAGIRKK